MSVCVCLGGGILGGRMGKAAVGTARDLPRHRHTGRGGRLLSRAAPALAAVAAPTEPGLAWRAARSPSHLKVEVSHLCVDDGAVAERHLDLGRHADDVRVGDDVAQLVPHKAAAQKLGARRSVVQREGEGRSPASVSAASPEARHPQLPSPGTPADAAGQLLHVEGVEKGHHAARRRHVDHARGVLLHTTSGEGGTHAARRGLPRHTRRWAHRRFLPGASWT